MAMWSSAGSCAQRVAQLHEATTGGAPTSVASAPATWVLIGENVDHFGGVTIVGLSSQRVAAAVSARSDDTIHLEVRAPGDIEVSADSTLASLTDAPAPAPSAPFSDRLLRRVLGLVHTMITRQVLPRSTTGMNITVVSDITAGAGLGALYASDAALALALAAADEEIEEAPMRTRLAEICSASANAHSTLSILRARHTVALRGAAGTVSVVDYADDSVTQAPHPGKLGVRIFSITKDLGEPHAEQAERITAWRSFIDDACANFGVSSLRQLPHAADRVGQWVDVRSQSSGADTIPDTATARGWVHFCETETLRSLATAKALRSRREQELFTLLNSPSEAHDLDTPDDLVETALANGAVSARPAAAGMSQAVIAFVPQRDAQAFIDALAPDFEVVEVLPGEAARIEDLA